MTPAGGETSSWEAYLGYAVTRWAIETGKGISFSPSAGFRLPDKNLLSPGRVPGWPLIDGNP